MKKNYPKDLDSKIRGLDDRVLNVSTKTQNDSNKELRTLDSLARLFKGTNNLAALFNKDKVINVFYNPAPLKAIDNQFASQFFNHLSAIKINKDNSLLELQILNIKSLVHDLSKNIVQIQANMTSLNKVIIKLFDAINGSLKGYVEELSSKVVEEYYTGKDNTAVWNKYISCLFSEDIGTLLSLYQECYTLASKDKGGVAQKIIRNFKDFNKVVKYYGESDLKNIEFPIVVDENGDDNVRLHAELQALDELSSKAIKEALIGISKLCCYQCDYIFKIFNDINKTLLIVRGTHGKIYLGWLFPEGIQNGEKIKELFLENCKTILNAFDLFKLDKSILDDPNNSLSDIEVDFNGNLLKNLAIQGENFLKCPQESIKETKIEIGDIKNQIITALLESNLTEKEIQATLVAVYELNQSQKEPESNKHLVYKIANTLIENKTLIESIALKPFFHEIMKECTEQALKGSGEYGEEKPIDYIDPHFGKYTLDAIDHILSLRINDLQLKGIKVLQGIFIDQNHNNISDLLAKVSSSKEQKILVPLNLLNKHAVGLIFEKSEDNTIQVKYLDSLNKLIPQELRQVIIDNLDPKINFQQIAVEQQKYANCAPEVIENFIFYLTRNRVCQEKAIELYSKLVENTLLNEKAFHLHLQFSEPLNLFKHDVTIEYLEHYDKFYNFDYDKLYVEVMGESYALESLTHCYHS